jgi:transcriptional regulator with XRE-family HTH domain
MALTLGEIVANNLRRVRQAKRLTQEELAHRVGMNRNYVGMIERCENSPTVAMLERMCQALQIDASVLFERERHGKREL